MREIKFRAWGEHQMIYPDPLSSFHRHMTWTGDVYRDGVLLDWHLMQFTGLTDKNGKKIYEGDVVSITDEDGETHYKYSSGKSQRISDCGVGQVVFDWGLWYVDGEPSNSLYDLVKFNSVLVEVIGNIHENPDLLNAA